MGKSGPRGGRSLRGRWVGMVGSMSGCIWGSGV